MKKIVPIIIIIVIIGLFFGHSISENETEVKTESEISEDPYSFTTCLYATTFRAKWGHNEEHLYFDLTNNIAVKIKEIVSVKGNNKKTYELEEVYKIDVDSNRRVIVRDEEGNEIGYIPALAEEISKWSFLYDANNELICKYSMRKINKNPVYELEKSGFYEKYPDPSLIFS